MNTVVWILKIYCRFYFTADRFECNIVDKKSQIITWRDEVINSMKFIAAGHETLRFAFDSYFGRRYHGYLGRIIRLVSRAITISMA